MLRKSNGPPCNILESPLNVDAIKYVYRIFRQVSGNKSDFNSFLYYFGSPLAINIEFVLVKV
jgi:hypothetical protein